MIVFGMSVILNIIECITQYRPLFHLHQNWFYLFCFVDYQFIVWVYISTCVIYSTELSLSCSISSHNVSALTILPNSTFLYTCLACSSVKYQLFFGSIGIYLSTYISAERYKCIGVIPTVYEFKCPGLRLSSELMVFRLSCVFIVNSFNDVCSSFKLSIC